MEKNKQNIIKLRMRMQDPKGILIPRGVIEELTIEIADEVAIFYFKDSRTTKRFADLEIKLNEKKGITDTIFLARIGKATTQYKGKTKEEIRDLLLEQFKQMGLNTKK